MIAPPDPCLVLIADDDREVLNALRFALELEGYQVGAFATGSALLEAAHDAPAACLVIDQKLPDTTGLELITRLLGGYRITDDLILCTVFGGICIGAAIGLVIRMGASTGGMDIPPLILNKYFKIPVSSSIYVFDMLILLLQVFHSTGEQVLYGILLVIVYSAVLDKCLMI